jgi:hypothetical protein
MSNLLRDSFSYFVGSGGRKGKAAAEDEKASNSWINDLLGDDDDWSVSSMSGIFCTGEGGGRTYTSDDVTIRKSRSKQLWLKVRALGKVLRKKGILHKIHITRLVESVVKIEPNLTALLSSIAKEYVIPSIYSTVCVCEEVVNTVV